MNPHQIAAYQTAHHNETAHITNQAQGLIDSHQRAVAASLRVLRDIDHALAMFEDRARTAATDWMYVSPMGDPVTTLAIEVNAAHAEALLDDLACELCGRRELSPTHRGIGHTHTPAEDPQGRAWAILGRIGAGLTVPAHVAETARMMVANDLATVVGFDHESAVAFEWFAGSDLF